MNINFAVSCSTTSVSYRRPEGKKLGLVFGIRETLKEIQEEDVLDVIAAGVAVPVVLGEVNHLLAHPLDAPNHSPVEVGDFNLSFFMELHPGLTQNYFVFLLFFDSMLQ